MPSKVTMLDIESTNLDADFGYTICVALKELNKPAVVRTIADYELHEREPWNDKELLRDVYAAIAEADVIVTYYGKGFDWGFLNARLLANNLRPLPETTPHIDLYFIARRALKISSRSLGNLSELAELERRKAYAPRKLWVKAQAGHVSSIKRLGSRCRSDVEVLEDAYIKLRGLVRLHPNVGREDLGSCRFCGEETLQRRGFQVTTRVKKARVQCTSCGAWDTRRAQE